MSPLDRARISWKDLRAIIIAVIALSYSIWSGINAFIHYQSWDQTEIYDKGRMVWGGISVLILVISARYIRDFFNYIYGGK